MPIQKSIGTTVSATVGAPETYDAAGYSALMTSPVEIGRILESVTLEAERAGELKTYLDGKSEVIRSNETYADIEIVVHRDSDGDAGHDLLESAYESGAHVSLKFTLPSSGGTRYTTGKVTKQSETMQIEEDSTQSTYTFMPIVAAVKGS